MAEESVQSTKDALLQSEEQQTKEEVKEEKKDPSDNLTPDHPRFKEVIADNHEKQKQIDALQTQLDEVNKKIDARQDKTGDEDLTEEEEAWLDRIGKGLKRKGIIVTQDDLRQERQATQYEKLSEKHDGSDGFPKFIPVEVQAFAKKRGISDLEDAWYIMNRTAIDQVNARKIAKTPEEIQSEKADGKEEKQTPKNTLTPEAIANMSDEEYEAQRASILGALKPKPSL